MRRCSIPSPSWIRRSSSSVGRPPTTAGAVSNSSRPGVPPRRSDKPDRLAPLRRTGELATVEYREERAVTVVFVVDDRDGVHREPLEGGPDSYDSRCTPPREASSPPSRTATEPAWRPSRDEPGSNRRPRPTSGRGWTTNSATRLPTGRSPRGSPGASLAADLERRLPRRAQVVLCTPLSDRGAVDLVETLRSRGRDVTVVTPDLTTGVASASIPTGARIAGLRRTIGSTPSGASARRSSTGTSRIRSRSTSRGRFAAPDPAGPRRRVAPRGRGQRRRREPTRRTPTGRRPANRTADKR